MTGQAVSNPDSEPSPDVMAIEPLCSYLQFAKTTLYKLAQEGTVPDQKVGKHGRFGRQAIDEWLKSSGGRVGSDEQ